jgi:hypothetical protein
LICAYIDHIVSLQNRVDLQIYSSLSIGPGKKKIDRHDSGQKKECLAGNTVG